MLKLWFCFSYVPRRLRSSYFVTTPIFYVNGAPHIGHMQSCLYADAFARLNQVLGGNDVIFSTGTDEHGIKVQQAASAAKMPPLAYCTGVSSAFKGLFEKCNVSFTHFVRTTDEKHQETVQNFWKTLKKNGYITKGSYEGWYSVVDEAFLPPSQVKEIKEGSSVKMVSVETQSVVEKMSEENYIFPLAKFKNDLLYWLSQDVIKPALFADIVRKWILEGLGDLSVSRPASRVSWGIPVPDDDSQTIYVWLDALVNYLTVGLSQKHFWPVDCHVIGKDILKFHSMYWPAFLIAAGYEPPRKIFCHSHWTVNYEKMSKSKGNVVDPNILIDMYGCDGFRYFLLKASVPHSNTNYSETKIHRMLNAELADTLGNLLSRCCAKAINTEQVFPIFHQDSFQLLKDSNAKELIDSTSELPGLVTEHFVEGYFYKGLDCIMACLRDSNVLMQSQKPWELVKKPDNESRQKLCTVLHIVMEVLRVSGILLQPVVPTIASRLLDKLGISVDDRLWSTLKPFPSYYNYPNKYEGAALGLDSKPLYERRKEKK